MVEYSIWRSRLDPVARRRLTEKTRVFCKNAIKHVWFLMFLVENTWTHYEHGAFLLKSCPSQPSQPSQAKPAKSAKQVKPAKQASQPSQAWKSMEIYENLWTSVDIDEHIWKYMKICEIICKSMNINQCLIQQYV